MEVKTFRPVAHFTPPSAAIARPSAPPPGQYSSNQHSDVVHSRKHAEVVNGADGEWCRMRRMMLRAADSRRDCLLMREAGMSSDRVQRSKRFARRHRVHSEGDRPLTAGNNCQQMPSRFVQLAAVA